MEAGPRDRHQPLDGPGPQLSPDGPDSAVESVDSVEPDAADGESFRELRPPRRFRIWQVAPIVGLAALGSLMFAFPLAFEFGEGGAIVAMLGLLISGCAAGWGLMAARRVGYTWPGLPAHGSDGNPAWRVVLCYTLLVGAIGALAIWRVAHLR